MTEDAHYQTLHSKPTDLWFVVAFLFGMAGAVIGYVTVRDEDETMAVWLLNIGGIATAIYIAIFLYLTRLPF